MFVIFYVYITVYRSTQRHWGWLSDWSDNLFWNILILFTYCSQQNSVLNILQEKAGMHGLEAQFHLN